MCLGTLIWGTLLDTRRAHLNDGILVEYSRIEVRSMFKVCLCCITSVFDTETPPDRPSHPLLQDFLPRVTGVEAQCRQFTTGKKGHLCKIYMDIYVNSIMWRSE
jgi:hypothetical protein